MNKKPLGWRNESTRHSLASHGIKTGRRYRHRADGVRNLTERVNIHGMDATRWRCPECYRGLNNGECAFHGKIHSKPPVDLLNDKYAQEVAIDTRIWNTLKNNPDLTIPGLAKELGMSEPILRDFMNRISDEVDETTYLEEYRRVHPLKSRGNEGHTMDELEGTIYDHIKSNYPHASHSDIAMTINNMSMVQRKKLYDDIKE